MNAACPAANEIAAGANPAIRMANGRSTQSTVVLVPTTTTSSAPARKPNSVPASAWTTVWPVLSQFERSTASAPRMTQNEWSTWVRPATATASARPIAPRTLLCSQTEERSTWAAARSWAADRVPGTPSGWRPRTRCIQLRRSDAAA